MVMIGIDPHKRTHTAVAVDASADIVASRLVQRERGQHASCCRGLTGSPSVGRGRSSPLAGSAISSRSSSSPRAKR